MHSRDPRAEEPGTDDDRQGRDRGDQTGHDEGTCTSRREPVSQRDRPHEQGGQEPAANTVAPFPGDDPIMAEHTPGRLQVLEYLVGMIDIWPEGDWQSDCNS